MLNADTHEKEEAEELVGMYKYPRHKHKQNLEKELDKGAPALDR